METAEQKALRTISAEAAKKIPYVGSVAGPLVKVLWVIKEPSLWDQIKDQVGAFVEKKLVEQRLNALNAKLKGYASTLDFICTLEGKSQFTDLKAFQIVLETDRYLFYETSGNNDVVRQTLPLFTPMAVIHVMVSNLVASLSDEFEKVESNRKAFNAKYESLKKEYSDYGYQSAVNTANWRINLVEISSKTETTHFSGQSINYTTLKCYDRFENKTIVDRKYSQFEFKDQISDNNKMNNYKKSIAGQTREYWEDTVLSKTTNWGSPAKIPA